MKLFLIAILFLTAGLSAGEKRPFTISDLYRIKYISDPQISPDGKQVAFTATQYNLPENESNSDIWLLELSSGDTRRLTNNKAADFHPRWSPDGKSLLFVSYRENGGQAWLLPIGGGEPEQLTQFYTGVSDPEWMPDGKSFVFISEVFPEAGKDGEKNKELSSDLESGMVQAHYSEELLYRHWTSYRDWKYKHLFSYDLESQNIEELTTGKLDAPAYSLGGREFTISPDGRYIAFSVKDVPEPANSTNNDVWLLDLKEMEFKNITKNNPAFDGNPLFSPDGKYIAYSMQKIPGYEADRFLLAVYHVADEKSTILTEDLDNWVDDFRWAPESKEIYFVLQENGRFPVYRVGADGENISVKVQVMSRLGGFEISPGGTFLITSKSTISKPVELWRFSLTQSKRPIAPKQLTTFNKSLAEEVDIRPAEEVWISSPTGKKIHTFIIKPYDFDPGKKYPVVINVHGGPQMQWSDGFRGDWQVYPGAGYVLAFPNPHGSTGYGQDFTLGISKDWGGKVYEDVIAVADYMGKLEYTDEDNMGAMGWSWGGYFMMWLESHAHPFKTLASMMGVYNLPAMWGSTEELWFPEWDLGGTPYNSELYTKWSPHQYMDKFSTPCLVITGERDYRVPYTQSLEFFTALKRKGVDSRLIVFKNDGHWPNFLRSMPVYYNAHLEWFNHYLGGGPAPWNTEKMIRNQVDYDEGE